MGRPTNQGGEMALTEILRELTLTYTIGMVAFCVTLVLLGYAIGIIAERDKQRQEHENKKLKKLLYPGRIEKIIRRNR